MIKQRNTKTDHLLWDTRYLLICRIIFIGVFQNDLSLEKNLNIRDGQVSYFFTQVKSSHLSKRVKSSQVRSSLEKNLFSSQVKSSHQFEIRHCKSSQVCVLTKSSQVKSQVIDLNSFLMS